MDLALDNLQRLICHKTKPNQTKTKTNHPHNSHTYINGILILIRTDGILILIRTQLTDIYKWYTNTHPHCTYTYTLIRTNTHIYAHKHL